MLVKLITNYISFDVFFKGWNVETGDQISIGELYLMMGVSDCSKPVIHLSYTWYEDIFSLFYVP